MAAARGRLRRNPVHAALLHTGSVCSSPGRATTRSPRPTPDTAHGSGTTPGPATAAATPVDLFCCGHSSLTDGRLLAAGGTERYDPFHGLTQAVSSIPVPDRPTLEVLPGRRGLEDAPDMASGRWYPTLVTARTGTCLAVSGLGADGQLTVVPERFRDRAGWTALPTSPPWPLYAHLFLLVDGRVFYSGGQYGANNGVNARRSGTRTRPPCTRSWAFPSPVCATRRPACCSRRPRTSAS